MKIKTVWEVSKSKFDDTVNLCLEEGWVLGQRRVIPSKRDLDDSVFYAELVLLDPTPEPEPEESLDPVELIRQLQYFCITNECDSCQLKDWCPRHLPNFEGPADWDIPGEGASL